jgi:hypothetical protein
MRSRRPVVYFDGIEARRGIKIGGRDASQNLLGGGRLELGQRGRRLVVDGSLCRLVARLERADVHRDFSLEAGAVGSRYYSSGFSLTTSISLPLQ